MAEHENKHRKILNESGKARKCEYLAQKSSQTMRYQFKWNFEKRNIAIAPSVAVTSATEWQLRYRKNHFMTFKQNRFKPTNNLNSKQTSKWTNRTERNGTEWNRIDRYICTTKRANIKRNQIKLSLIKNWRRTLLSSTSVSGFATQQILSWISQLKTTARNTKYWL